jgi:ABC-type glycerol-3-phosphate transport system substrate-binding protein
MSCKLSRRQFVAATAVSSATLITAPHVRGAYAAGKLKIGFWDHWVPGANNTSTALVNEWAEREKIEVQIDYITSQGNKLLLTATAEAQAKSGHDILTMASYSSHSTTSWSRSSARTAM